MAASKLETIIRQAFFLLLGADTAVHWWFALPTPLGPTVVVVACCLVALCSPPPQPTENHRPDL